jgi:histidine ammonia-lyase
MSPDQTIFISGAPLTLKQITAVAQNNIQVALSPEAITRMEASRRVVTAVLRADNAAYGINTGFGKLSDIRIAPDQLEA